MLQYVEDDSSAWGLVVRLGPLLALQVLISTEVAFTLTLALACSLAVAFAVVPAARPRLVGVDRPAARRVRRSRPS